MPRPLFRSLVLAGALALAAAGCGTDDDAVDDIAASPSTESTDATGATESETETETETESESESETETESESERQSESESETEREDRNSPGGDGPLEEFACDRLDEDDVAEIIGDIEEAGFTGGGGTVNDTGYQHAGCTYSLAGGAGDFEVKAMVSDDVEDIFAFLRDEAEQDQFDDRFETVPGLGDAAFLRSAIGASENVDLLVKVGDTTLQISSDLEDLQPADLERIEQQVRDLAELAVATVE